MRFQRFQKSVVVHLLGTAFTVAYGQRFYFGNTPNHRFYGFYFRHMVCGVFVLKEPAEEVKFRIVK